MKESKMVETKWFSLTIFFRKIILQYFLLFCRCVNLYERSYSSYLTGIEFDNKLKQDIVYVKIMSNGMVIKVRLQDFIAKESIVLEMHPFDIAMLALLAKEDRLRYARYREKRLAIFPDLQQFKGVDRQFYSERTRKEMVVVTIPETDSQLCLSVRELLNHPDLMDQLREKNNHREIFPCKSYSSPQAENVEAPTY